MFDIQSSLESLREECEQLMQHEKAVNTNKAYAHCWQRFNGWCEKHRREPLRASNETLRYFVAWCVRTGLAVSTIRLTLAAVKHEYSKAKLPHPVDDSVRVLVRGASRKLRGKSNAKAAMALKILCRVSKALLARKSALGIRNRAILLVGFASGWRRSELAALQLSDISVSSKEIKMRLRVSKNDQEGKGREVRIPCGQRALTCPVRAMRAWLKTRGRWAGPLFCRITPVGHKVSRYPISGDTINTILKTSLELVGENAAAYGAHSLRAGMATAAAEAGATETAIMQRGGWKSIAMVLRYVRPARAFRVDPLKGVL